MKSLLLLGSLLISWSLYSQEIETVKQIKESDFDGDLSVKIEYNPIDSTLQNFHHFELDGSDKIISLGNHGSSMSPMGLENIDFKFNHGENSFFPIHEKALKGRIYDTNIPFARIAYLGGPKKYQNFNLFFTQNISARMNMAIQLETFGSDGFYLNQKNTSKSFSVQNSFKSNGNKYGYFAKFSVISGQSGENGGIKGDSLYLNALNSDKLNVQVWFDSESQNRYDQRKVEVSQFYRFGTPDSLHDMYSGVFLTLDNVGFINDLWYQNDAVDSMYFSNWDLVIPDSVSISDRSHLFGIENALTAKFVSKNKKIDLRFGYGLDGYKAETLKSDSSIISHSLQSKLFNFHLKGFIFNLNGKIGIAGYNSNGHFFGLNVKRNIPNTMLQVLADFQSIKSLPDYKFLRYDGSNISWDNRFQYVSMNLVKLGLSMDSIGFEFTGVAKNINNYVYYGSNTLPIQYDKAFMHYEVNLNQHIKVKSYHLKFGITYQNVDSGTPVNIPEWTWNISFYYQRYVFDKAMELRYGIDYWQNSSYASNYYAPFTRSFVYQNDYNVGNYPYVDFYISARIKSAQGFVKFQNLGQLVLDKSYMMTPYYPMQDFGFSFGVRWDFFN